MLTPQQVETLTRAANVLRPDWNPAHIRDWLSSPGNPVRGRPYPHVAVALAAAATDPTTVTIAALAEDGPWWAATRALAGRNGAPRPEPHAGPGRGAQGCRRPGHEYEPATSCRWCRAEDLAGHPHEEPGRLTSTALNRARRPA